MKAQIKFLNLKDSLFKLQGKLVKLQDKFIKTVDKLNLDKNKIILIILASLILIYLDLSLVARWQFRKVLALRPKVVKLKKDINTLRKELLTIGNLKERRIEAPPEPSRISKKIISELEMLDLLEYISNLARKNGIRIMQVKPTKEIDVKAKKSKVIKGKAPLEKLNFIPFFLDLNLVCQYHSLGVFINKLENSEYFFAVEEMLIRQGQKEDYLAGQDIRLILKTYVKE